MSPTRKILLATDFSAASKNALAHAAAMAVREGAELHVLHVDELHAYPIDIAAFPGGAEYERALREASITAIDRLPLPAGVTVVKVSVREVSAAPAIVQYAVDQGVDTIVVGSHGRTGFSRLFFGSVAQEVVRSAPMPVLVIGRGLGHAANRTGPYRVLAPVDFSPASKMAIQAAAAAAAMRHNGRLLVAHVIETYRLPPYFAAELESARRDQVKRDLARLIAEGELPVETDPVISDGRADERIVEAARDHEVNLIVMATAGHSEVDRLLLGSVTERVLRAAPCPVLVLHETPEQAARAAELRRAPARAPAGEARTGTGS